MDGAPADPILASFRTALSEIYGALLERAVLFGSRARGVARPDSDYDVAVFLTSLPDRWAELDRLADLRVRFLDETGAFFDAMPYLITAYRDATPLRNPARGVGVLTPQAAHFLDKARKLLGDADIMLAAGLNDAAGRTAYLAGFHAAQALIFERVGKVLKSHAGVQIEFLRMTKGDPTVVGELRAFLSRTYNLKAIADYETGPGSEISPERATEAIAAGKRFVAHLLIWSQPRQRSRGLANKLPSAGSCWASGDFLAG
jgi:uncharacterized protein (UPF0332 family)/predicted nucleotidyltransferase